MLQQPASINTFLDYMLVEHKLKSDAALARRLGIGAPIVSKWRNGALSLGPTHILAFHEEFNLPVAEIRRLSDVPARSRNKVAA